MNEAKHLNGIIGTITTAGGAVVAWLPTVNFVVQIIAGIVAIIVGITTIAYYHKKSKLIK